jgi:hypothetical protein
VAESKNSRNITMKNTLLKTAIAVAVVLGTVTAGSMHSAHADDFVGGPGGGSFGVIDCPSGTVVVGLAGRSGAVIDTMQLFCSPPLGGPEAIMLDPRRIGPSNGGGPISAMCPVLKTAAGIDVNVARFDGHVVVSQIILRCRSELVGSDSSVVFGGGGGDGAGGSTCPDHTFMVGLAGRSGDFIDALGITCIGAADVPQ